MSASPVGGMRIARAGTDIPLVDILHYPAITGQVSRSELLAIAKELMNGAEAFLAAANADMPPDQRTSRLQLPFFQEQYWVEKRKL